MQLKYKIMNFLKYEKKMCTKNESLQKQNAL